MPSSGKALICDLVSSLPNVDPWVMLHYIENILALNKIGILNNEVSKYLLRTNHNVFFHDSLLLRNSNFRKSDITSIIRNVKYNNIKERLHPDESKVLKKYKDKVITHYCLHFTTVAKKLLFETFKSNLLYLQVYRSPITFSMINRIANWTLQIEKSKSRDGHIKFFDKKVKKNLPYFMKKKSKEYFDANKYEKAIIIIGEYLNNKIIKNKNNIKKYKSKEMIIPFENLIKKPEKYLKKISKNINSELDKFVFRTFKKNRVPRKFNLNKEKNFTFNFLKNKIRPKYYNKLIKLEKFYQMNILKKF